MSISRRKFIGNLSAGVALMGLPSAPGVANSLWQEKKLGVALVGLGYYAEFKIATALKETSLCQLKGIVTGTPAKAEKWKKQYNLPDANIYNYQNFDRIADNKEIDVVYVVLPNSMHHEFVIRAAKAGKHVITEKPMATSVKECEAMIAACKQAGVRLFVGYRLHFEPFNLEARRIGQQKVMGNVKVVESEMGFKIGDPTQWRLRKSMAGGGAMMDVGIYAIQGARYCIGQEPISVTAQEVKTDLVKFKEVDETILWQMEFPNGVISSSMTSYAASMERLYIAAENGWLQIKPSFGYGPFAGRTHKEELNLPQTNHQALQMDGMVRSILDKTESTASGEEGLRDMKVIEAIYRAIASGRKEKI